MVPFHTFILKVASRCNLNCSYCFVYNQGDNGWKAQPKFMSLDVAKATAKRMGEHCAAHSKDDVHVVFHGGEPTLLGPAGLNALATTLRSTLAEYGVKVRFGMQTNGALLSEALCSICSEHQIGIGVSLDGPPRLNGLRVDHNQNASSAAVENGLEILTQDRYRHLFRGFLVVVNKDSPPSEVLDYLLGYSPPAVDFLLPYDNWDRRPPGKENAADCPYGAWLIEAFDYWRSSRSKFRVREFESLIRIMFGGKSILESTGVDPVDLIVIEANGDIEGVDSLKAVFDGATKLGFNVTKDDLDAVLDHVEVKARQVGLQSLCDTCVSCDLVTVCGGGYLPNRYSRARGYDNPSIYCEDLKRLIWHIRNVVCGELNVHPVACA